MNEKKEDTRRIKGDVNQCQKLEATDTCKHTGGTECVITIKLLNFVTVVSVTITEIGFRNDFDHIRTSLRFSKPL